jgi:hypothetical protein
MMEPITRTCRECGQVFTIGPGELELLERLAHEQQWNTVELPKRCTPCRAARRRLRETVTGTEGDLTLRCVACGVDFAFRSRDREYYASHNYQFPRRCPACRTANR